MILVDTSVWADHLRSPLEELKNLLEERLVLLHPYVIGEISLGNLRQYDATIRGLLAIPQATPAKSDEVLYFIRHHRLPGSGIGYVDAHLLASCFLTPDCRIWTRDKRLAAAATRLGISYP
jgi:predicted nucleic acid-binding protein